MVNNPITTCLHASSLGGGCLTDDNYTMQYECSFLAYFYDKNEVIIIHNNISAVAKHGLGSVSDIRKLSFDVALSSAATGHFMIRVSVYYRAQHIWSPEMVIIQP